MHFRNERLHPPARLTDRSARAAEAGPYPDSQQVKERMRRNLATRDELAMLEAGLLVRN